MENIFEKLNSINVNEHTEGKNGLTYLSWAWAWSEFKKIYPQATYDILRFDGLPYVYDEKTGYMVYTSVEVDGLEHTMWLPVMDSANAAMKAEPYEYKVKNPNFKYAKKKEDGKYYDKYGNEQPEFFIKKCKAATMFDINKTLMRCLTKNLAMFGLGLYIYAGEDLPEEAEQGEKQAEQGEKQAEQAEKPQNNEEMTLEQADGFTLTSGKYNGVTLGELMVNDKSYVEWLADKWHGQAQQAAKMLLDDELRQIAGVKK